MSKAHQCDGCGELHEGPPKLTFSMKMTAGSSSPRGLMARLMTGGKTRLEVDFCSIECLQAHDMNGAKDALLAGADNKDQLLEQ